MVDTYISVRLATAAAILNITNNGQTMESTANAVLTVDGVAAVVDDWILVKDQAADDTQNGLYQMTQLGIAGGAGQHWILKRQGLGLMLKHNMLFHIVEGTANVGRLYRLTTADLITPGATSIPAGNFVIETQNIVGNLTGDVLATDATQVLENGTDGTNAWAKTDIHADNNASVLVHGTTGTTSTYTGTVTAINNISAGNLGTVAVPATGTIAVVENGDAYHHRTTLTITNVNFATVVAGAGALAFGELIYTLPAGNAIVTACNYNVTVTSSILPAAATVGGTDGGIGTTLAAGVFATLDLAGAGAENVVTGTAGVVDGATATTTLISNQILSVPTANNHTVYLNIAATWTNAETITITTGTVVLDWIFM